jgi:hypothetical protein
MRCEAMNGHAFPCALLGALEHVLPFEHRPAVVAVLRELGEHAREVHLPVAQGPEAPGAVDPGLVARIDALPAVRVELGVLDVEGADALVVDVDEGEVVQRLSTKCDGS